jgi:hypothetical protein
MICSMVGAGKMVSLDILLTELGLKPIRHQWLQKVVTFWNSLVQLPEDNMYAQILRDSCFFGVTTRSPSWAGAVMQTLRKLGYPYNIDCNQPYPIDLETFRAVLHLDQEQPWAGLHTSPRLAPSVGVQKCTYQRWFARPPHINKYRLLYLPMSARKVRQFLRFRMGLHDLPVATGRLRNIPRAQRVCDICEQQVVGDEHHFVYGCPTLEPVRAQYSDLFRAPRRSLRQFLWQDDLVRVVNFIIDCFQYRASVLNATL